MKRLSDRVGSLSRLLREQGLAGLWDRVLQWAWRTTPYLIVSKCVTTPTEGFQATGVQFRIATEEDVPWICRNMSHQGEAAERLARQHLHGNDITVVGALTENPEKMVFSVCLSPNDFGLSILEDVFPPGDVGIRRGWVPPEMRSIGVGTQGMHYAEYAAYEKGVRRIWGFVLEDNASSRRMLDKAGYEEDGSVHLIMRFGRRYAKIRRIGDKSWRYVRVPTDVTKL